MKILFSTALAFIALQLIAQYPAVNNTAFAAGEKLTYRIYYHSALTGSVTAGKAVFEVSAESRKISGRETHHIVVDGSTQGAFNFFYKVKDRFESFVDIESLLPLLFLRRINEDGYIRNQDQVYDHVNRVVHFKDNLQGTQSKIPVPAGTHDILSAIYYLRNADVFAQEEGNTVKLRYVFADSLYTSQIRIAGYETVQTGIGKVSCIKVQPQVLTGSVFSEQYPLTVWVSNDKNRLPVMARSEILVGSVRMELVSWSGLKNPFSALKK